MNNKEKFQKKRKNFEDAISNFKKPISKLAQELGYLVDMAEDIHGYIVSFRNNTKEWGSVDCCETECDTCDFLDLCNAEDIAETIKDLNYFGL